jgi:hypothetical protein
MDSESLATSIRACPSAERSADRSGRWMGALLALGTLVYLSLSVLRAIKKPLWYDELFTFYLAAIPKFADFREAMARGPDLNPPLLYFLARELFAVFGTSPLVLRVPSISGYLIMSLCLYWFAARRVRPAYAWAAASFPLVTQAYDYAFEGRPYALVLGFSGLALIGWQMATDDLGNRRRVGLAIMSFSLAAAVSSHYYAVLVFVPIGLGELARSWSRRSIDFAVWVALFAGLFPLVPLRVLIQASRAEFKDTFWARPSWSFGLQFYLFLFKGTTIPLVMLLAFLAVDSRLDGKRRNADVAYEPSPRVNPVPLHEVIAALGFLGLPFVGLALAKLAAGGAFTERYALPAVIGFGLLLAYVGDWLGQGRRVPGAVMTLIFCGWFVSYEAYHLEREPERHLLIEPSSFRPVSETDLPLVFSWSIQFLQAYHDLPHDLSSRCYYLTEGKSTDELALRKLSRWVPLHVVDADRFLGEHQRFFVCGFPGDSLFRSLLDDKATVTLIKARRFREGEVILVLVDRGNARLRAGLPERRARILEVAKSAGPPTIDP